MLENNWLFLLHKKRMFFLPPYFSEEISCRKTLVLSSVPLFRNSMNRSARVKRLSFCYKKTHKINYMYISVVSQLSFFRSTSKVDAQPPPALFRVSLLHLVCVAFALLTCWFFAVVRPGPTDELPRGATECRSP